LCLNDGAVVTETDTIQWADRCQGNCRRWIWCHTSCKTSALGNSCVQATESFNHCWWIKVCFEYYSTL